MTASTRPARTAERTRTAEGARTATPLPSASALDANASASARSRLRTGLAQARALWRDFTGESAYDRYVERHHREHPDHPPMSEREWWRAKADFDEANVQAHCC